MQTIILLVNGYPFGVKGLREILKLFVLSTHSWLFLMFFCLMPVRGMAREEAKLKYITITQKLDGFGDEYHPAKVCVSYILVKQI